MRIGSNYKRKMDTLRNQDSKNKKKQKKKCQKGKRRKEGNSRCMYSAQCIVVFYSCHWS